MLKLYNTLTKSKEEFKPINAGKAGMYVCGPTVYDYIHIGNIRAYITADVLRRYLEYLGFEVRMIKNITDVGHLTQDDVAQADSGEDKILVALRREKSAKGGSASGGKTPEEIAKFYEEYFHKTEDEMNILAAHYFPKATAHIPQMIKMISALIKNECAYEKNGNVFFDVTKFSDYGKLSGNTLENLKVGARLEKHPDKINPWDFALWLKAPEKHLLKWDSPWSKGYPGWHIECSAMSMEYLGETIDIHTGGEDNIFPHHEAEIAQSQCATGKKFVNFWVHCRHLLVDGEKMSKSKENFYKLEDIKAKGYNPMVLRLAMLSSHYRGQMNFTWEAMEQAKTNLERISNFLSSLKTALGSSTSKLDLKLYQGKFEKAMDDDLNTPLALSVLYELITETNKLIAENKLSAEDAKNILAFWEKMNKVFGLVITEEKIKIPGEIKKLAEDREQARKNKDFTGADKIRKTIEAEGFIVEDAKGGWKIKKL